MKNAEEVVVRLVSDSIGQTGDKTIRDRTALSDKPDGRLAGKQGVHKTRPQGAAAAQKLLAFQIDFTVYYSSERRIEGTPSLREKHEEDDEDERENHYFSGFLREELPQKDFE